MVTGPPPKFYGTRDNLSADRRNPLRQSPARHATGCATPKWLVRTLPAELWSGRTRRYAAPKLRTSVKVVAPKVP
jgi:hypothetical protein